MKKNLRTAVNTDPLHFPHSVILGVARQVYMFEHRGSFHTLLLGYRTVLTMTEAVKSSFHITSSSKNIIQDVAEN
jgi:hypothetical protein